MVMRWVGGCGSIALLLVLMVGCGASDPSALDGVPGSLDEQELSGRGSLADQQAGVLGSPGSQGPLADIHFGYDAVDLGQGARDILQRNYQWLEDHPDKRVEIEGHCDDRGTIEYNLALGARRAAAAKNYLVALGVSSMRITTISYGEELPLCREVSDVCRRRNRRGHFVVFGE